MPDFGSHTLTIAAIARFDLPGHTIRLCDGGFLDFDGERYTSADPVFGSIGEVESYSEATGDEAPGLKLTFLPKSTAAAADLSQADYQGSRFRSHIVRINPADGQVVHSEPVADMLLDTTTLRTGKSYKALDMEFISYSERLFAINEGNVLSDRFHQSVHPGELGLSNATGMPVTVAHGVAGPPRGASFTGGSAGGGGMMDFGNEALLRAH